MSAACRKFLLSVIAALIVGGCSSGTLNWPSSYHIVARGDTLYSISWQYGMDYRVLARWNDLGDGTLIREGQVISLVPPDNEEMRRRSAGSSSGSASSGSSAPPLKVYTPPPEQKVSRWQWPTTGTVVAGYGRSVKTESGIRIGGEYGQSVSASSGGTVVYAGSALKGYGNLLIVKHNDTYLSAYGFNSELLVSEGQSVQRGQQIARMGTTTSGDTVLHFEIRKNGQPVDPGKYLPSR